MSTKKVKDLLPDFEEFSNKIQVKRLKVKMLEVCDERLSYAADELLLLSEEILSQVSAYGVCLYFQNGGVLQTEKNNDLILHELFLHRGHQNAGPIFYKVRDIVNEIRTEIPENEFKLFDVESNINKRLQELAAFRNALMHGFFKLPASRNEEIIKDIQKLLQDLIENYNIFKHAAAFHFWNIEGFSGHWNIQDNDDDWNALAGEKATSFEKLASLASDELHSADFVNAVSVSHEPKTELDKKGELEGFISSDFKESLYVQFHPRDKKQQDEFYENAKALINQKENVKLLSYTINENGIGFTSYLLIHHLLKNLALQNNEKDPKQKIKSKVKQLKKNGDKIIILINNIHLVPFASDHVTSMMKFFKESGIHFIGIGWEYEHLNSIFSQKLDLRKDRKETNIIPDEIEIDLLIKNHTRHRGPYENENEYVELKYTIKLIYDRLIEKKPVIARQFADEESLDIELINEALYILYPYFKYDQLGKDNNYIQDELDELYGFPKTQTETSSIFLTLGRRDIDLEYKHKILKP